MAEKEVKSVNEFDDYLQGKMKEILKHVFHSGKAFTPEELAEYMEEKEKEITDVAFTNEQVVDDILIMKGYTATYNYLSKVSDEEQKLNIKRYLFADALRPYLLHVMRDYSLKLEELYKVKKAELEKEESKAEEGNERQSEDNVVSLKGTLNTVAGINKKKG